MDCWGRDGAAQGEYKLLPDLPEWHWPLGYLQARGTECHTEHEIIKVYERSVLEMMFSLVSWFDTG